MFGINGKFGFGCMRLPMMENGKVDIEQTKSMVDSFMQAGFNYFDTAHVYLGGQSETALREALVARYPRESYLIADKITYPQFGNEAGILPFFEEELKALGVDYIDVLLMHGVNAVSYEKFKEYKAFEKGFKLKEEGKVHHVGLSFHDSPDVIDRILTDFPEIEVVQLQLNYLDFDSEAVRSEKCLEVCRKHNKPVIVMEPLKGGSLVNLPQKADEVLKNLGTDSNAGYALRFAVQQEGVACVLSGVSSIAQMEENLRILKTPRPLTEEENSALEEVKTIIRSMNLIPCTGCRYCTPGCPVHIEIPSLFTCMNTQTIFPGHGNYNYYFRNTANGRAPSDCIMCGQCERACPQHLKIRDLLKQVGELFEAPEH